MSMLRTTALAAAALLSAGCYHATVTTGATPSAVEVIDEPFASGWIYGLVPPKTVEAAEKCTSGVAKVETRQSFVNGLVGMLTLGIYTPMHIRVTCAASTSAMAPSDAAQYLVSGDDPTVAREVLTAAATEAFERGEAVVVRVGR